MSRSEYIGERETLRVKRRVIEAEIRSHRDSLLAALSIVHPAEDLQGEYIAALGVKLNERLMELAGVDRQIALLSRELGD